MTEKSLSDLAKKIKKIDIAMLATNTEGEEIAERPMSNNGNVEYDGTSYYFTSDDSRMVSDIQRDPKVSLSFQGEDGFRVAVQGDAKLIKDKEKFKEHWDPDLDQWFEDGIDTKGLVMIEVKASRIHYWDGEDEGEVTL